MSTLSTTSPVFTRRHALAWLGAAAPIAMTPITSSAAAPPPPVDADPLLWLEEVQGERALAWVRQQNAATRQLLEAEPGFATLRQRLLEVLDSKERIPQVSRSGDWLYNLWRDGAHPRGVWRRTTLAEFRLAQPSWQTLLDVDALAKAEGENWVWAGVERLGGTSPRCLISLSRGGADAVVVREFDTERREFVADGFKLPEAKTEVQWLDAQQLLVATDFGPGSLTDSGYARTVRLWQRGQPLAQARTVYEAKTSDVGIVMQVNRSPGFERVVLGRSPDFFSDELLLWHPADGRSQALAKPADSQLSFWRDQVLLRLRSNWTVAGSTWPGGSLLAADAAAYLRGERRFTALFTPTPSRSLAHYSATASQLLLTVMDNVAHRAEAWRRDDSGRWSHKTLATPFPGALTLAPLHDPLHPQASRDPLAEQFLLSYTDFLTPDGLWLGDTGHDTLTPLKSRPSFFDAQGIKVEQRFARSKDGTSVPYFIVWPRGAQADGNNPTLLYGYGGFEVSLEPWYLAGAGRSWLSRGGVFVVANIRGGGEFGPAWHQAALKHKRQRAFDDFIAVAEDLIARKVTQPRRLGIQGGSNGGLLVGAVMVQRPELFNAVVCQVPLLDMRRFHLLLAGASWMAEYGNPDDPEDWAAIARYSPYHNLHADRRYPKVLFITSTRDDRVHPAHARKMAARMMAMGHPVLYHENIEGGHGAGADNFQHADRMALEYAYLWRQLGA